jgi:hypothetical protein
MSAPLSTGPHTEPDCRRTRGDFVGQEGFMRASEILALVVEARGRRRWPADSAARTGNLAAARPATAACRPGAHSVTSQTAGHFDVHLAGNGEATFTAPTQPGEYALYCTYHPSMKGTLMVQ